ncbi:hypothetical protein D3C86_960390 [compost metagenome]
MSKLSKFKSVIPMVAATKLLSDLIGEKVDVNDLMSLYEGGWLRLFRPCHGEIVKLKVCVRPTHLPDPDTKGDGVHLI